MAPKSDKPLMTAKELRESARNRLKRHLDKMKADGYKRISFFIKENHRDIIKAVKAEHDFSGMDAALRYIIDKHKQPQATPAPEHRHISIINSVIEDTEKEITTSNSKGLPDEIVSRNKGWIEGLKAALDIINNKPPDLSPLEKPKQSPQQREITPPDQYPNKQTELEFEEPEAEKEG